MESFKSTCKTFKSRCRNLKNSFFHNSIINATSASQIWSTLHKAGLTRKKNSNCTEYFDKTTLNNHYCRIAFQHPECTQSQLSELFDYKTDPTQFTFSTLSEDFFRNKILVQVQKTNNTSPDGLSLKYLSNFIDIIIPPY